MTYYDWVTVAFYFVFIGLMGFVFSGYNKNPSDYFRAGASMVWWMVGATAFMTQFSAWTFIGAASKAYTDGFIVSVIFFGNALGFLLNFAWTSSLFRQMRLMTSIEAIRERFDITNEQFFTYLQVPTSIVYAGIWLSSLAVFFSAAIGADQDLTLWVTGLIVLLLAATGGSWAVAAGDFVQMVLLMTIAVMLAVMTFMAPEVGGVGGFFEKTPSSHWNWTETANSGIIYFWVIAYVIRQVITTNSLLESYRFFYVKDGPHARQASLLAFVLMTVGPLIWFVPPMAASFIEPNLGAVYPMVKNPTETAYVFMGERLLPPGLFGLLVCGIFAATMSSMDAGLNRNAGILVKNIYHPYLNKKASEAHLLDAGRIASFVCGIVVILVAQYMANVGGEGLFEKMMLFAGLVGTPLAMPMFLGIIWWRTPPWSGWSTVVVGAMFSAWAKFNLNPETFTSLEGFSKRELNDLLFSVGFAGNVVICTAWFVFTGLFYEKASARWRERVEKFRATAHTPVDFVKEIGAESDNKQALTLGWMCILYAAFFVLMAFIPHESWSGPVCFLVCAGVLGGVGLVLRWSARTRHNTPATVPVTSTTP